MLDWCVCRVPSSEVAFCLPAAETVHERYIQGHAAQFIQNRGVEAGSRGVGNADPISLICAWESRIQPPKAVLQSLHKILSLHHLHNFRCSSFIQFSQDQMNTNACSQRSFLLVLPVPKERAFPRPPSLPPCFPASLPFPSTVSHAANCRSLSSTCPSNVPTQQTRRYRVISHPSKSSQEPPPSRIPSARKAGSPLSVGFNWNAPPRPRSPSPGSRNPAILPLI
ncbi:hypothetical protein N431DRAFT_230976 [Stipitochalara longipes BDJ]|nr:hypothetical protein N431DRAFT_230976 [Stipitochalara longipes BDJ]